MIKMTKGSEECFTTIKMTKGSEECFTTLCSYSILNNKKKSSHDEKDFSFDHWMGEKENRLGNVTLFTI